MDDLRLFQNHIKMEYQKITNLLDTKSDNVRSFITKKQIEVHDQYNINKQVRFKTSMLRSDLCDYSDAYIVVKGAIAVQTENNRAINGYNRNLIFENNVPLINCISKINNVFQSTMQKIQIL